MPLKKKHLILDMETMSTDPHNGVIIDVSIIIFDWNRFTKDPYTSRIVADAKRFKLSVRDQVSKFGYKVDPDTVDFWSKQDAEVRKRVAPKADDLTVDQFCKKFLEMLTEAPEIGFWWSRSNGFDAGFLWRVFADAGYKRQLDAHLRHGLVRDTRTFIDAKLNFPYPNGFAPVEDEEFWNTVFKPHDSAWDVAADVLRLQAIVRAEEDLEQVKR